MLVALNKLFCCFFFSLFIFFYSFCFSFYFLLFAILYFDSLINCKRTSKKKGKISFPLYVVCVNLCSSRICENPLDLNVYNVYREREKYELHKSFTHYAVFTLKLVV